MVRRIFLDSNHWITLARVEKGKETDSDLIEVYEKIKNLSDSKDTIFPFSMFHLEDILKNTNKERREELIDFMIGISKGWVMKPFLLFREQEVENALLQKIGAKPIHDIISKIFAKGVAYTAGLEYHFSSKTEEGKKFLVTHDKKIREYVDSLESMSLLLKNDEFCSFIREDNKIYLNAALTMENFRQQRQTWTKTERFDNELISFFNKSIEIHLIKFLKKYKIEKILHLIFQSKQDFEQFLEFMPSSNILVRLTFARDEESPEHKVQPNDLIDISHLSEAVPYCDIVVMEKMFASICRRIKLDQKYDCQVLSSLKELNTIL